MILRRQKKYDLIAVLGNGLTEDWQLPDHMRERLGRVLHWYTKGLAPRIAVSGKWSSNFDKLGIVPPVTEASLMANFLTPLVGKENIYTEDKATDTLQNAYYLKKDIVEPHHLRRILVVCSDHQEERAQFLFGKVFGPEYTIKTLPAPTPFTHDPETIAAQKEMLEKQRRYLAKMKDGDDRFLETRIGKDPTYPESERAAYLAMGRRR